MSFSLEQSPELYKTLFETSAETLIIVNREGVIVLANPRIKQMLGYEKDEIIGKEIETLIPVDLREIHKSHRNQYVKSPKDRPMGVGLELYALNKNKEKIPVEISLNHFTYEGNFYVMALLTDISKRQEAQEELKKINNQLEQIIQERSKRLVQTQHLYRLIARNFPNGIISVIDEEFDLVFIEGQDLYKLGVTSDKLVGTSYLNLIPKELKKFFKQQLLKVFKGENQNFEVKLDKGSYLINTVGLKDDQGKINQILIVEQNITKQKIAEEQMREALQKEKELNELKSRFVSMASHEFRTPLSTILSSTALAKKYPSAEDQPKRERHYQRIEAAVKNLTEILEDFLSLNKLEENKIAPKIVDFDLIALINETMEEMELQIKKGQKIILKTELASYILKSDPHIIKNILYNLVSNAIKYTPENKTIEITAEKNNENIILSVKDEGIGIPEKEQKNLFQRFFRAENAANIKGTGLGLYITKKYLDLLKGTISFESKENKGTVFTITLTDYEN
jgi:PAS domain S-box-containing protein